MATSYTFAACTLTTIFFGQLVVVLKVDQTVDADPLTLELLGCVDGRTAAAEGIEHDLALVSGRGDDDLRQMADGS